MTPQEWKQLTPLPYDKLKKSEKGQHQQINGKYNIRLLLLPVVKEKEEENRENKCF